MPDADEATEGLPAQDGAAAAGVLPLAPLRQGAPRLREEAAQAAPEAAARARARCLRAPVPLAADANEIAVIATDGAGNAASASVTVQHGPGLLPGDEDAAALAQVRDTDTAPRHESFEIETTPAGLRVARGEIGVRIEPNATVAQVNAALGSVGGTIAGAVRGAPQLAVTIPDPGSLAALENVLDDLRDQPGIERATLADMPATNELPPGFASPLSSAGGAALGHLIALRMPAAWNARRAIRLTDRPTLIVAAVAVTPQPTDDTDHTFDLPDWQPVPVEP